ncbi:MAG: relaxase/mobilization nuclease domain-containing protein [Lachnospiraceae bacterium]|nr:relaxase/mobilization nuclease domain-containing protein [Lachnospiraceae bacterium]
MAIIKHISIKNSSYTAALEYLMYQHDEFTNKPILNERGEKILRDDFLLDGVNCNPMSFGRECQQTNLHFHKNQTKREIKAHHYILSFDPRDRDENGLTAERAQELGMEFARRNFPGHQILICTHPDGHNSAGNIHVHIVINSVRKMTVERQDFMERPGDNLAGNKHHVTNQFMEYLRQDTMDLCQSESLYQVDLLSPAKVKITDREYWAQRKGQAELDAKNAELLSAGIQPKQTEYETEKNLLRKAIASTMKDSSSIEEFQKKLFEQYGISTHESRGRFSYQMPDRNKPIRARQLGTNFEKEYIISQISNRTKSPQAHQKIRLIVDLENNLKAQQNRFYAQKVKIGNLQQMAKSIAFLKENGIDTMEDLSALVSATSADYDARRTELQATEARLKTVNLQIKNTGQYLANKKVYGQYLKAKNKKEFREAHTAEIMLYEAARKTLKELSGGEKLPSLKQLQSEKQELTARKNQQYEAFSFSRAKYRELQTVDSNIRSMQSQPEQEQEKKMEL